MTLITILIAIYVVSAPIAAFGVTYIKDGYDWGLEGFFGVLCPVVNTIIAICTLVGIALRCFAELLEIILEAIF